MFCSTTFTKCYTSVLTQCIFYAVGTELFYVVCRNSILFSSCFRTNVLILRLDVTVVFIRLTVKSE